MKNRSHTAYRMFAAAAIAFLAISGVAAGAQPIEVRINGERVHFADIGPQHIHGRTMVPVRGVLEKLGADITFNSADQTVTAKTANREIQLVIGSREATVNSRTVMLDVPAQTMLDHTFVPLRFLGEALGAEVRWDEDAQTVFIRTRGEMREFPDRFDQRRRRDLHPRDGG